MNDKYLLEDGTGGYLLEDATGYYLMQYGVGLTLNTANGNNFSTPTPTLEFTGTHSLAPDLNYEVEIRTSDVIVAFDDNASTMMGNVGGVTGDATTSSKRAQSFTTGSISGNLFDITISVGKTGTPTDNLFVAIHSDSGNLPGTQIAVSTNQIAMSTLPVNTASGGFATLVYTFSGLILSANTRYWLSIVRTGAVSAANYFNVQGSSTVAHPGETGKIWNGTAWVATGVLGLVFKERLIVIPVVDVISGVDTGFLNTVNNADIAPFTIGQKASYTVQTALASGTYYWRVKAIDPTGTYFTDEWSPTRSFTAVNPDEIGIVKSIAQYEADRVTPIAIGASTGTGGVTTDIYLEQTVSLATITNSMSPSFEVRPVATAFTGVATATGHPRVIKEPTLPVSKRGGTLHYDSINKRMILFGGFDGTNRFGDFWEFDTHDQLGAYRLVSPTGTKPAARNLHAGTSFTLGTRSFMLVWGGVLQGGAETNDMGLVELTTRGSEVSTMLTQTSPPTIRSYISEHMVVKKLSETQVEIYLYGGWAATYENAIYKCTYTLGGTSVTWSVIGAQGAANAPGTGSRGANCIYDLASNNIWVFGGYNGTLYNTLTYTFNLTTNTWTQVTYSGITAASRELASSVYDQTTKKWYVFGGYLATIASSRNDIVQFDLSIPTAPVASLIRTNDPNGNSSFYPQSSMACAFDTDRREAVMGFGNGIDDFYKYVYLFDPKENEATDATMYGLNTQDYFRARDAAAYCYNPVRNEMIMVGGYSEMSDDTAIATGAHTGQIWVVEYNSSGKSTVRYAVAGNKTITPREGAVIVYDTIANRYIVFGGLNGIQQVMNDVWELKADIYGNYKARRMKSTGATQPISRWLGVAAFDATNNRVVIWGGEAVSTIVSNTDMWALNLSTDSVNGDWVQLAPTGIAPSARWQPGYWHDVGTNQLYITGGSTTNGDTAYASDLARLDLATAQPSWTALTSTGNKAVRGGLLMGSKYNDRLWYFGGGTSTTVVDTMLSIPKAGGTWASVAYTGTPPAARRSASATLFNDTVTGFNMIITSGRPVTGIWYSDFHEIVPTSVSAVTTAKIASPTIQNRISYAITGQTTGVSYHWQSWATTSNIDLTKSSFGANAESAADFITGSAAATPTGYVKIWNGTVWIAKPKKVWNGTTWVIGKQKIWNGTTWIEAVNS